MQLYSLWSLRCQINLSCSLPTFIRWVGVNLFHRLRCVDKLRLIFPLSLKELLFVVQNVVRPIPCGFYQKNISTHTRTFLIKIITMWQKRYGCWMKYWRWYIVGAVCVSFWRVLEVGSCFEVRLSRIHCSSWAPAHWAATPLREAPLNLASPLFGHCP